MFLIDKRKTNFLKLCFNSKTFEKILSESLEKTFRLKYFYLQIIILHTTCRVQSLGNFLGAYNNKQMFAATVH